MKTKHKDGYEWVSLAILAKEQGKSPVHLKLWYTYAEENERLDELPQCRRDFDKVTTRYLRVDQLDKLDTFGASLKRGELSQIGKKVYGDRTEYHREWYQEKKANEKPYKSNNMYINLPVKDLNRTKKFFSSIGFEFNSQFSDENSACMVINDNTFVQLLVEPYFQTFINKPVADVASAAGKIIALSADSRKHVDELADKALSAGGKQSKEPTDHGFMYVRSFEDLNGHLWEIAYMDMGTMTQE
ncbi:VOC family protein [Paenibacillus sp. MMO-58]|uniref:VOC family protein n=1 Tax=Paenibacillus sp. MMO-58 TaxID=3081290 RepID=UPI003FA724AB